MTEDTAKLDTEAMDRMSVAPDPAAEEEKVPGQQSDAGTDESIAERLEKNPESQQARLDRALDESMDASDPPSGTQPVHSHEPPASSGYDEEAEKAAEAKKRHGELERESH